MKYKCAVLLYSCNRQTLHTVATVKLLWIEYEYESLCCPHLLQNDVFVWICGTGVWIWTVDFWEKRVLTVWFSVSHSSNVRSRSTDIPLLSYDVHVLKCGFTISCFRFDSLFGNVVLSWTSWLHFSGDMHQLLEAFSDNLSLCSESDCVTETRLVCAMRHCNRFRWCDYLLIIRIRVRVPAGNDT